MIGFYSVVGVGLGPVPGTGSQLIENTWVHRRLVGGDFYGQDFGGGQRPDEETPSCDTIPPRTDIHVDDLPELIDRPIDVAPAIGHLDRGFVHPPAVPNTVSARACCLRQQRCEALHPTEDADVVDVDASLREEFFHVPVRRARSADTNAPPK